MRKRLVRLKKDRFTPPLSPIRIALAQNKISLFSFIVFGLNFARARFVFAPLCSGVAFANNLSQPILPWGFHNAIWNIKQVFSHGTQKRHEGDEDSDEGPEISEADEGNSSERQVREREG